MQRDTQEQREEEGTLDLAFSLMAREGCDDANALLARWWLTELY